MTHNEAMPLRLLPALALFAALLPAQAPRWRQLNAESRAAIDAMPDREAAYEDGYTAGELKWADAMDKQIGIEESLRTHLAASQADVARLRYALKQIQDYEHSASQMKYIARAAIRDTQP